MRLDRNKAAGIDEITKAKYEANLDGNIADLLQRMKTHKYRPQAVRRVYIPKAGSSKMRPLGIPSYEDKTVQLALNKIIGSIFEQDFPDSSLDSHTTAVAEETAASELKGKLAERNLQPVLRDANYGLRKTG